MVRVVILWDITMLTRHLGDSHVVYVTSRESDSTNGAFANRRRPNDLDWPGASWNTSLSSKETVHVPSTVHQ